MWILKVLGWMKTAAVGVCAGRFYYFFRPWCNWVPFYRPLVFSTITYLLTDTWLEVSKYP